MLKILIVEGNTRDARELTVASGSFTQGDLYERTLRALNSTLQCDIVYPADCGASLPTQSALCQYDGIIWTGSSLNIYEQDPAVTRQVDFMKSCYSRKVKMFGSCWGLQVAVVAAGGEVAKNTKGREIGLARDIQPTILGQMHPLYKGKNFPFDAVAIHLDHVVRLPQGASVLSGNDMSRIQALEIRQGDSVFWGVQYHPEFDLSYMASIMEKYKDMMVDEGFCPDAGAVDRLALDYRRAQDEVDNVELHSRHKMTSDVLDPCLRLREINNWLNFIEQSAA